MKFIFSIILLLAGALFVYSSEEKIDVKTQTTNKVDNLLLPADQAVKSDEGFIVIKAECKGSVKWLVISPKPVKYITNEQNNTLIVGIPPSGSVTVLAVGLCENKLTEFAKTIITVKSAEENCPKVQLKQQQQPLKW
jgi:hypothetical protein